MKYILTSGCSFTKNKRFRAEALGENTSNRYSWPEGLQKQLGDSYNVINLGSATNDNVSIIRILYYWINKLNEKGIKYDDMIIGIQWSDLHREAFYFNKDISSKELSETQHTLSYVTEKDRDGFFFLTGGFAPPEDENIWKHFEGTKFRDLVGMYSLEITSNNFINQTLHWLEAWSHFEMFCEQNKIKTFYLSMRNNYSKNVYERGFEVHDRFIGGPNGADNVNWMLENPMLYPYVKNLPIETKSYFHKNYCGLYEWTWDAIERYPDINPYQELEDSDNFKMELFQNKTMYGHPSAKMMEIFAKEELKPFLDERIFN
ncbi:hypothetical protein EB151_07170 [archaeon]|nr:hypothetical protein [archaeon]